MWYKPEMLKHVVHGLFWAGVFLLLAWRVPALAQGFTLNQAGVQAISLCGGTPRSDVTAQPTKANIEGRASWFELAKARCAGDTAGTAVAARAVLAWSAARMGVIHNIGQGDASLAEFAARTYPGNAEAHFWLAEALASMQDDLGAIQAYEAGLALDGTDADAWIALGRLYEAKGDMDRAVHAYDQACYYVDYGKNGCVAAARLHMLLGQYDKALTSYEQVVVQIPSYPAATKLRPVDAFVKAGRTGEAADYLRFLIDHGVPEATPLLEQVEKK